ncbi:CDP-diacylglycerol--serine O-phosphatidyltransferase [methanotrophic endosymbiont of Bathymodiolus puteoserpentis (Logatchev)]|jgi:CDP-diacylglycerol--serine O-phosphatidyltransferase|uniref:CDP-diacylglycerol--serine O-phosphatidyltransferase n=1 Tax=methanotrophic endosymbiont of Bathymodiolus puteoserpentis (Logatchev) TaxID=343235 RepID=UPI0013CD6BBC|nr:CDP-diacylglycerol--serine O-phosphatidyltransferase [methanotrophic endosymbiont of Bathymodiolus puteoserpentis (Logatchev)]SHE19227.1 CDP-diacylglycerol--serine O-phosphatidyltransferase [methanotrophic endosymbiont of Bathymodiolus puteoserpentis (Logatchev)]
MTHPNQNSSKVRSRGIYLLPNLFTTAALFSGFYAIASAISGRYETAAILIFVSLVLDGLDGRVARMTNTQSDFGAEYDSMADMISFGAAPAIVMYLWSLSSLGQVGLIGAFVHLAGGALRLARFNTQLATQDKNYFQGLPSPAAASLLAGFVWVSEKYQYGAENLPWLVLILTVTTGLLMVSNFRYHSFKDINFKGKVPFVVMIFVMLGFAITLSNPATILCLFFFAYALSGPIVTIVLMRRKRQQSRRNQP